MENLQADIMGALSEYGPSALAAIVILFVGWILGRVIASGIAAAVDNTKFGKSANEAGDKNTVGRSIGDAAFWVVMLVALTLALGALRLDYVLAPMNAMLNEILVYLPKLVGAGLIFLVGTIFATVARRAVTGVLSAAKFDDLGTRVGISSETGKGGLSNAVGLMVYALILIPVAIVGLDALGMAAISVPATMMLQNVLDAIPNIFAAGIVLFIAYLIAKATSSLLQTVLPNFGFDKTVGQLGLITEGADKGLTPSIIAARLAGFSILLFGAIEAANLLRFDLVSDMLAQLVQIGASVLFGAVIIAFGVIFSGVVARAIASTGSGATDIMAEVVRWAIIILASAMGLRQMGLADEIVNLGFGLLLGAAAIAGALAFGLGGRDWARSKLEQISPSETRPAARKKTPPPSTEA
jgi:hypothetical protein